MKHLEQTLKPEKWSIMTHGFRLNLEGGLARYKLFSTFACVITWHNNLFLKNFNFSIIKIIAYAF